MRRPIIFLFAMFVAASSAHADPQAAEFYEHGGGRIRSAEWEQAPAIPLLSEDIELEVTLTVQHIVSHTGLLLNFSILPYNVPNAMSYMASNGDRLLLYNPDFIRYVNDKVNPDWGVISVFAHEIGHHLQGHIFKNDDGFYRRELEADEFSGFVMYRMGATLAEAQISISKLAMDVELPTHPGREKRAGAIARGWFKAQEITAHESEVARARDRRDQ